MELQILVERRVKRPRRSGGEVTALWLAFGFNALAFHLPERILPSELLLARIATRTWDMRFGCLVRVEGSKLPLCGAESSNVRLPALGLEGFAMSCACIVKRAWIRVSTEQQILTVGDEAGCACSAGCLGLKCTWRSLVSPWTYFGILAIDEVIWLDLDISCSKELEVIMLGTLPEITLLEYVLMTSWLHTACHIFLSHYMSLFFVCIVALGLGRQLLDQLLVMLGPPVLLFEHGLLLQDAFHHFHAY